MSNSKSLITEKINLPSPPTIAIRILEAVKDDQSGAATLARIISADPALSSRILMVANSSLYALHHKSESIDQAVTVLGTDALKNIALSFVIFRETKRDHDEGFNFDLFWKRSLTAAVGANVFRHLIKAPKSDFFVTALLQDIGVLLMYLNAPDNYLKVLDDKRATGKPVIQMERQIFGFDHPEVSAQLLESWGLPEQIYMPIRFHHQNGKSPEPYHQQAKVLYLADKVASVYHGTQSVEKVCCIKQSLSHDPTLNEEDIDAAIDDIGQKSLEILSFFDIDPGSMKPYSQLLQEANEELGKLNLSYEQLVMELKQAKEKAENLAYDLKSANERLRKMAMRDGLTGLYNHSYFQDIMVKEISKAKRYKRPFSLILLDLDYFKKINDNYGHPVGDEVLKGISATLIKSLRNADTVARYGGEEFAIVLPETHLKQAVLLAERLRKTIEKQEYKCSDHQIRTTVSVGVSTFSPAHGLNDPKSIITSADQALYLSKNKGRNRISINIPNAQ